ncbi:alkaline phosphatase family protein [Lutibacter holmesii]|uniref:Alkaline phosphatase family protein n=1 Tax=Lutibacter holmesii TaxID=1137985 RepID=A0ABW3WKD0_9FLAO
MKNKFTKLLFLTSIAIVSSFFSCAEGNKTNSQDKKIYKKEPKLVLQITVDQLRGDLPYRFLDNMGEGGFRYLLNNGIVFTDAHHSHANTETIVGHTTLSTGANPSSHGMVANVWLNRSTGYLSYNIEDGRYPLLSENADVNKKTEIDPTQRTARSSGRSPSNILVSTLSDELNLSTNGEAKVFGVSVKDRGAIAMAGQAGKAFWFSKSAKQFVTSAYYYNAYPEWVSTFNKSDFTKKYGNQQWNLLKDKSNYLFGESDDQQWETNFPGFGITFPHNYGDPASKYFGTILTLSPAGDEITLDFAKTLIENEAIGQDDITDYLSVSFSSTDYVGHVFGPSSLEMEDNLLHLDRTLADLLSFVDKKIGLENTLIVLSADHGSPEAAGYLTSRGIDTKNINTDDWDKKNSIASLKKRFGIGQELIKDYFHPYVYLNHEVIKKNNLNLEEVQLAVSEEISKFEGVSAAVSSTMLNKGLVPNTSEMRFVLNNHNSERSGDIYVVFKPHLFVNDFDGLSVASAHGSPWSYDTFVPIIFAGYNFKHQQVNRKVHTIDIAPTLAKMIGSKPPSGSEGTVLVEVVNK